MNSKPLHSAVCPCCASSLLNLEGHDVTLHGKLIGPVRWCCAYCGYSLMGLAVPVRPVCSSMYRHMTCLEARDATEVRRESWKSFGA